MSKSIIRAYTAWWPEDDIATRKDAENYNVTELWTTEYMKGEGFTEDEIEIVENLQVGDSHRFTLPEYEGGSTFDVVVCYDGEEYEDTSYQFQAERECHHLNWYEVSGRGDRYDDRY